MIDMKGDLWPIGVLSRSLSADKYQSYMKQLVLHLCEILYGHKVKINSLGELRSMFLLNEESSKFKHPYSVFLLTGIYQQQYVP